MSKYKFFSLIVALALFFSACDKNQPLLDEAVNQPSQEDEVAVGVKSAVFDPIVWKGESDKAAANNDVAYVQNNTRKNASGPKITSNAHSADFPGVYFIWDSKQKDNGYLKIDAKWFNGDGADFVGYESLTFTTKESNNYYDFTLTVADDQVTTDDGCYVFFISKVCNNKNINMVFIDEAILHGEDEPLPVLVTVTFHIVKLDDKGYWNVPLFQQPVILGFGINWKEVADEYAKKYDDDHFGGFADFSLATTPLGGKVDANLVETWRLNISGKGGVPLTHAEAFAWVYDKEYAENTVRFAPIVPAPAPACGGQITATFPGVKNVAIQYYSAAKSWETAPGMFDDEATIVLPEGLTVTSLRAVKDNNLNGMYYQVNGLSLDCKVDYNFEVPVIQLRIFGMNADCNIGVIQNNWVYPSTPVPGGKQQLYWVFDNGKNYTAQLSKAGFYSITSNAAERTVYEGNEELWISFGGPFYEVTVPAGITNVRMQSNNWIVNPANEGDKITLLADYGNIRNAKMSFVFEGKTYNVDFKLDGTNPFTGLTVINVPGLTDVTLQYYHFLGAWGSNGEWVTVGTFDETSGFINIPAGTTAIRVVKAGMSYQVDVDANAFNVINVPVLPITVMVNQDCKLAVVQSDWVYNWTPATTGANVFNVFANGKTYDVRMQIGSNPVTSKTGVNAGGTVTF